MNSLHLKIIAIITMLIDHIGLFFYPEIQIFRIIGRLSFPIFAFLLINTYNYTNNLDKKINKFWIMAIITQIIFEFINYNSTSIFISMWLALESLKSTETNNKFKKILFFISTIIFTLVTNSLSIIYEVTFIIIYYCLKNTQKILKKERYSLLLLILIISNNLISNINIIYKILYILFTILGIIIPNKFYNGKYGNKKIHKILWYVYPVHFIILHIISTLI